MIIIRIKKKERKLNVIYCLKYLIIFGRLFRNHLENQRKIYRSQDLLVLHLQNFMCNLNFCMVLSCFTSANDII